MKAYGIGCALAGTLAVSVAQAASEPTPISRATALGASVEDLARNALLKAAPRFVEVERPTFSGMFGPDEPVRGMRFATAAESAGNPGLCKATIAFVSLDPGLSPIQTNAVFKVVGELKPLPDMWNEPYGAELSRKCAAAGRVLPTGSAAFGEVTFFSLRAGAESDVWLAARALELAIAGSKGNAAVTCHALPGIDAGTLSEMAADDPEAVEDRENQEVCVHPAAVLADLSLGRLHTLDISACPGEAGSYCVSALFLRYAYFNHQALWEVTLKYEMTAGDNRDAKNVRSIIIGPSYMIYD